jgi:GNAT superfamily N-acetyltransferase
VEAFLNDPTWSWAFPDASTRERNLQLLWQLFVDGAQRYPWVWLTPDDSAASVWIPPGGTEFPAEQEANLESTIVELFDSNAPRVLHAFELFEAHHPHHSEHYYLNFLGTATAQRGRGLGLGLLANNLTRVDAEGMPAYLEASNPVNVALYERQGFRVLDSFTLPDGGPQIFTMWREPTA